MKMLNCHQIDFKKERLLTQKIREKNKKAWVLLTKFPVKKREYYQIGTNGASDSFDLIGFWEICSGGLRRRDLKEYAVFLSEIGWSVSKFEPYFQIIKENEKQNTGGFGIGLERLLGAILGNFEIGNIQPYPRIPFRKVLF